MEHLFRFANDDYGLGTTLRYPYPPVLLQGIVGMVGGRSQHVVLVLAILDLPF